MTKTGKRIIVAFVAAVAVLVSSAFLLFSPSQTAFAARDTSQFTVIGGEENDIWIGGNKPFNSELLENLYTAIAGVGNFAALESKVKADSDKTLTSADFRENNADGNKNISVWFGGKKWDVVYLTVDKTENNLVLDLWQSADNISETPSKYANRSSSLDNPTARYPDNMYSSSLIRVETLNNGGYASTGGAVIPGQKYEPKTSESENTYARFTSSEAKDSVVSYLVQPKNVAYQETENAIGNSMARYTVPNDAYGTPNSGNWYMSKYNYAGKGTAHDETKYEAWQNDYLWLPSLAETGDYNAANQNGLWKTDESLRSTEAKGGKSHAWLRSGYYKTAHDVYTLSTSGGSANETVQYEYLVRPALHLNLTTANNNAGTRAANIPAATEDTKVYSGAEQEFTITDGQNTNVTLVSATKDGNGDHSSNYNAETGIFSATDAGQYTLTFKPAHGLTWQSGGSDEKTVTLQIDAADLTFMWPKNGGGYSYEYGKSTTPTPTADFKGTDGTTTSVKVTEKNSKTFKNVGEYTFTAALEGGAAGNYNIVPSSREQTYNITKATITLNWIGEASYTYKGSAYATPTASIKSGEVDGDGLRVTVEFDDTSPTKDEFKNAGEYIFKATLEGAAAENYDIKAEDRTHTYIISKAHYDMLGVTFNDVTVDYDGKEHSIFVGGDLPHGVNVDYEGNGQSAVGVHTVTAIFTGDEVNYYPIDNKTAKLTILRISHDLSGVTFGNVTVKYDGETHDIYIGGGLPHGVTVTYEGNGQKDPNIYTVTAVFSDADGVFDRKTATLTILRLHAQAGEGEVAIDSNDGFDPTLELVFEKAENVKRSYSAWEKDKVSEKYAVKLCKNGEEVTIGGKVTVRLLIPEKFRDKDFELKAAAGTAGIEFTRDGDYAIFETDGLSEYVFTSDYTPYFPMIFIAIGVMLAEVLVLTALVVILRKKEKTQVR